MSDPLRSSPADLEAAYFGPRPPSQEVASSGGAGAPAGGPAPSSSGPVGVLLPPDQYRPGPQSLEIYAISPIGVTVGPGPGAVWAIPAAIVTQIPGSHVGRLATFGVQVLNMLATAQITFRLRVNGAGTGAWGNLQIPAAALAVTQARFDIYVKLPKAAIVDVQVQVDDAGSYPIQVYYQGWSYPAEYDALYARGVFGSLNP